MENRNKKINVCFNIGQNNSTKMVDNIQVKRGFEVGPDLFFKLLNYIVNYIHVTQDSIFSGAS